jgi:hypothetical protein
MFECRLSLSKIDNNDLAIALLDKFDIRKKMFFDNDIVWAGIYLDPRFNFLGSPLLSDSEKSRGIQHLKKTFDEIKEIKLESATKTLSLGNSLSESLDSIGTNSKASNDMEDFLSRNEKITDANYMNCDIETKLIQMSHRSRVQCNQNIKN